MLPRFTLRLGSQDLMVFQEVLLDNEYRLPDAFAEDDVVIDVGAHTGSFAVACLRRGAWRVVSYEPDAGNFALLQENTRSFGERSIRYREALWCRGSPMARITLPNDVFTAQCHCFWPGGQPVAALTLDQVLTGHERVRLLKLDCEGGEWPGLFEVSPEKLAKVDEIVGELHFQMRHPDWPQAWCVTALKALLEGAGFAIEVVPGGQPEYTAHFFARRAVVKGRAAHVA